MQVLSMLYLISLGGLLRTDLLVWVIGIPILVIAVVVLFLQQREYLRLRGELAQLAKMKRNAIEYDLVLKAMKLSVWRIDVPSRTITYESDYRENIGMPIISPGSDVEQFCNTLLPESKKRIAAGIMDIVEGRSDEFHEQYEMVLNPSGKHCWGELFATVDKRDMNGRPVTIVGTSMSIDKQKEIERALIEARNKAQESDRLKTAFLANISHEVRTPLNAIVGFSDVLPMAQSDEERSQLITLIKENNTHLLRLFDELVVMSKLDAGGEAVMKTQVDVSTLVAEVAGRYQAECQKKGIDMKFAGMDELPPVNTDRNRLKSILDQYLNNAVKFTDTGSVTIGGELRGKCIRLWVRDTGKGIPAEHCGDQLFERFFKVDEFVPGTGLGLSICLTLAQSLGGTLGVESKEGEGSLFWVEIALE
jgi:signal transduction histidine kinase